MKKMSPNPRETLISINPNAIFLDGHDDALLGLIWLPGQSRPVALYDDTLLAESIVAQNPNWSIDDAYEWIDANVPFGGDAPAVVGIMPDADELEDAIEWS
jgi:hypothetical protein